MSPLLLDVYASPGPPARAATFDAMVVRTVVAVLALSALAACAGGSKDGGVGTTLEGSFGRFDGSTGTFTQYRGKPVVVNFFSSTCLPCQSEMPALEQVHRALGDQVTFLGLDVQDTVEGGQAFVQSVGVTWELGRDPKGEILQAAVHGSVAGLPTTFVLDRDGHIAYSHLGPLDVSGLTNTLRQLHLVN